jgi:hypothetical protein
MTYLRRSLVVAVLAVPFICGVAGSARAAGRESPPSCTTSQLRLKLGPLVSEKTEQHTAAFVLINEGRGACTLDGYPAVRLLDTHDQVLPFAYGHRGDQMITSAAPKVVTVPAQGSAYFEFNKNACVNRNRVAARSMQVKLPGSGVALTVSVARYPIADYCGARDPGNGITMSPIEATLAAASCHSQGPCGRGVPIAATASLPSAGTIVATLPVSVKETPLFSASGDSLFVITFLEQQAKTVTVERVDANGTTHSRRLPFPLAYYLMDVSTGPNGFYAGTSVIKRFTTASDVLVRFDRQTLALAAQARFPARVAAVEQGARMWASIGDGRVIRLDPKTLSTLASRQLLTATPSQMLDLFISKPALGLGSLWVVIGDAHLLQLVRLDPQTLAVRSRTNIPRRPGLNKVIGDARHVYLVGTSIERVGADGALLGEPVAVPNLAATAISANGLVGLTDLPDGVELLSGQVRVIARTALTDSSGDLAVAGDNAWLLGNAGHGNGIVHLRLAQRVR